MTKSNYKKLKEESKNKLLHMCSLLFPIFKENNISIKSDGHVIFKERGLLPFFRKGIKKHVSYMLFTSIPIQLSILRFGNTQYVKVYRKVISTIVENTYQDEVISAQYIIDYLYKEMFILKPRNFSEDVNELAKLLSVDETPSIRPIITEAVILEDEYTKERYEEPKKPGLTYILDTFIDSVKTIKINYRTKKTLVAASIVLSLQLISAKEMVVRLKNSIYESLYTINSPPISYINGLGLNSS